MNAPHSIAPIFNTQSWVGPLDVPFPSFRFMRALMEHEARAAGDGEVDLSSVTPDQLSVGDGHGELASTFRIPSDEVIELDLT